MWYYSLNNQPTGPVDGTTIRKLIQSGIINEKTLVWQEGMVNWQRLIETPLKEFLAPPTMPTYGNTYNTSVGTTYPGAPTQQSYPYGGAQSTYPGAGMQSSYPSTSGTAPRFFSDVRLSSLKGLFIWWLILTCISLAAMVGVYAIYDYDLLIGVTCFYELAAISSAVLMFILLHRFWKIIQDGYASTTPGKAVGFLFIPFYNFYWLFRAYFGLSNETNQFIDRHFSMTPGLQIRKTLPVLSLLLAIGTLVNGFVSYFFSLSEAIDYGTEYMTFSGVSVISTVIFTLLQIATFVDFYLTGKSILEAQGQQM